MQLCYTLLGVLFVSVWGMPSVAGASVLISEVAWMGSAENANAEWIELYNTTDADVAMEGWTLIAEDGQPSITLSGTLGAGQYGLLERTSDDTVPGIPAFLIYTGALGNSGEVLVLNDAGGVERDRVDGRDAWAIGGDNATKETLQRIGEPATGVWVTAPRTPGRGGAVRAPVVPEQSPGVTHSPGVRIEQDGVRTPSGSTQREGGTINRAPGGEIVRARPSLTLSIGEDTTAMAGSVSTYRVRGYDENGKEVALSKARWNFGDGTVRSEVSTKHAYRYAGTYVVVVYGARGPLEAHTRKVVEVSAFSIEMPHADATHIVLRNTGAGEVDLARFTLGVGTTHFRIPADTVLLSGASVTFPATATSLAAHTGVPVGLFYPDNTLALLFQPHSSVTPSSTGSSEELEAVSLEGERDEGEGEDGESETAPDAPLVEGDVHGEVVAHTTEGAPVSTAPPVIYATLAEAYASLPSDAPEEGMHLWWWVVGGAVAIMLGITVVAVVRDEEEEVVRGYLIEDEPEREV